MKTSVVLCTYNGEKHIVEQINSILKQTEEVDEVIVSDDNSSDQTLTLVEKQLKQSTVRFKILKNDCNVGVTHNFLNALSYVSGDIIYFSDQDDIWFENKVEIMNQHFISNPNVMLICSDAVLINNKKEEIGKLFQTSLFTASQLDDGQFVRIVKKPFVTGATMAIRKQLYNEALPFSKNMLHDQWLSLIAASKESILVIEEALIYYRQHDNNVIGAGQKQDVSVTIKKNINKRYGEEQFYWFLDVYNYLLEHNAKEEYLQLAKQAMNFWQIRSQFYNMTIFEVLAAIKVAKQNKEYEKYAFNLSVKYEIAKYLMQLKYKKKGQDSSK